jgi:hypothetical protein
MKPLGRQHPSKPPTDSDKAMSKRHLATRKALDDYAEKDSSGGTAKELLEKSIKYNASHRDEHDKALKDAKKQLEKAAKDRAKK